MEYENPDQISLKGSLILAAPSLQDSNFYRSVLLLTEHTWQEGAHGYILNRPLGKRVAELFKEPEFESLHDVPVFVGGPVGQENLTFSVMTWHQTDGLKFSSHISTKEAIERKALGESVRAFVGYAGWSEGQLETELKQRAWITRKPEISVLNSEASECLWTQLLSSMGPWYHLLSKAPDNPSLN